MSFTTGPVFTNAGRTLHARALAGATLKFTKMQLGDGSRGSTAIADLKALVSPVASVGVSGLRYSGNFAVISGMFSNADLHTGFNWNEIGLFAADPDAPDDRSRDILYCYQDAAGNPDYIPASDSELITKRISIAAITSNATNVTATFAQETTAGDIFFDNTDTDLEANDMQTAIKELAAQKAKSWAVVIPTAGWSTSGDMKMTVVPVSGMSESYNPTYGLTPGGNYATETEEEIFALIKGLVTADGSVTLYASEVPSASITLTLREV